MFAAQMFVRHARREGSGAEARPAWPGSEGGAGRGGKGGAAIKEGVLRVLFLTLFS